MRVIGRRESLKRWWVGKASANEGDFVSGAKKSEAELTNTKNFFIISFLCC